MSLATPPRIDPRDCTVHVGRSELRRRRPPLPPSDDQDDSPSLATNIPPRWQVGSDRQVTDAGAQQQWQQNHLIDLYRQLQDWAGRLDAREAELTAISVIEEQRQRQIHLRKLRSEF